MINNIRKEVDSMKQRKKLLLHIFLLIGLTIFALWFSLHKDMDKVLHIIRGVNSFWLFIALGMGVLYYVLSAWNVKKLILRYKHDYTMKEALICTFSGAFFNGITPVGGGQVAQTYLFHKQGLKIRESASVLWMDFIIYQSAVLLVVCVLWAFRFIYFYQAFGPWIMLVVLGFFINGFVIFMLYTMMKFPKVYVFLSKHAIVLLHKVRIIKNLENGLEKWHKQLEMFTQQITVLKEDKKLVIELLAMQFLRIIIFYGIPYIVGLALHVPLEVHQLLDILVMSSFIQMLNALTPLPGDTGFTESCFIIIFSFIFPWNLASAVMLLWRVCTYHLILVIGGVSFVRVYGKKELLKLC